MGDFVHLHNHSHYSLQDAACTIDSLVDSAVKNNMHAIALTDHGVMYGATEFYKKATKAGIKPLIGMEAYIVMEGKRTDKQVSSTPDGRRKKHYNHLVLLAKNETGYKNLIKLSTLGFTEGFYYKPRIDLDLLREKSEGLICLSACPAGVVSAHLVNGNYEKAKEAAILMKEIFAADFYLEIQNHGMDVEKPILEGMPKLAKELGIKLVATNDIHYVEQEHSIPHNILLLLSDKTGTADYKTLRYNTDQVYFKSSEEMKELFKDYEGAIENTLEIADKINFEMNFSGHHYPNFPIPEDSRANTLNEYLDIIAGEGLEKKYKNATPEILDRFNFELETIKNMGYAGYFLIVADFINAAKERGIPVGPGRGSAAGSLVAYVLGITNVDPLDYDLLFERFLNPARKSMPDIDIDFADNERGDVIDYVIEKYGEESVCQIITFNRLSSKAVLRDVARVLKIPIPTVNNITKWIPSKFGRVYTIEQALNDVPELKWVRVSDDPILQELIKYSKVLEGMNRNLSKHAAGVVITDGPVSDYVPLATAGADGDLVTQYNMKELESVGLLKMDFLGLRTLTIIKDTIKLVKKTRGEEIDIDNIPNDDEKTYALFAKGQTTGVFQFESAPMREYLKKLKPTSIKDLAAMNALYRPGPMEFINDFISCKHGRSKIKYQHPILEPILKETYGIIVYQEQVIQIANKVAGMSLAEADLLRRAMGKKDKKAMDEQGKKFIEGAIKNNLTKRSAQEIFDAIYKFADYGFNKSHAVAYSIVAYQTAYLKSHYLEEFLAANLTNEFGNTDKVTKLLEDCRKLKIKVMPPIINQPSVFFDVEDGKIVFGMSAVKNVGVGAVEEIEKCRNKLGRNFTSIYDFCSNIDTRVVNKRALEGLVLAGAFDFAEGSRAQHFAAIPEALNFGNKVQSAQESQAGSLFGDGDEGFEIQEPELPDLPSWDTKTRLAKEREVLGFYLSDHPLSKFEVEYNSFANIHLGEAVTYEDMEFVRACGVITELRTKIDKAGRNMAFFTVDDFTGSCECLMFAKNYAEFEPHITKEATVVVVGKLESSGDAIKLHAEEVIPLNEAKYKLTKKLALFVDENLHGENVIKELKTLLENHEGNIQVFLRVKQNGSTRDFFLDHKVKISEELTEAISKLLGEDSIKFVVK
ncbi:DNA polymerase III subunit alpha [Bacteroidota bacterium]